jgi:histidinol-phosphate aminotransferase
MIRPQPRVDQLIRRQTPKVGRQSKLRLDINENIAGWPESVIREVLSSITPGDLATYPETHALYAGIARRHGVTTGHVLVANGSELVIRSVFEAFLGPGSELLILDPSFAMFEVYGRLYGADIVKVPFGPRLDASVEAVLGRLTSKTRVVAIANPNNPTGTVFSPADLLAITTRAADLDCLVLVDEAYFYFYRETMAPLVAEFGNLIVTRTFSKAFGLAGVRIGYALGAPAVMEIVQKLQPIDHASVFAVKFGQYAIEHEELAWEYAREVAAGKTYLVEALRALGLVVVDSHANFILVDLGGDRERVIRELQDSVLLGTTVRLPFPNEYIKITVGPVREMERLVGALRPSLAHRAAGAARVQE